VIAKSMGQHQSRQFALSRSVVMEINAIPINITFSPFGHHHLYFS
ncbi:MAG: hypothetical protein ACI9P7_001461, partial [Candidatus Azotimanducaceae bacterium]